MKGVYLCLPLVHAGSMKQLEQGLDVRRIGVVQPGGPGSRVPLPQSAGVNSGPLSRITTSIGP